jgi:hypothetical protein
MVFDLLASYSIASIFSAHTGALDRLGIHHPGAGLRISHQANPKAFSDGPVDHFPGTVDPPSSEVVVDGGPSLGKSLGSRRHYWQPLLKI